MKSEDIKSLFIDFFKGNKHIELEEYSLIPFNDKSLLFTNSGMVQFKNIFLGLDSSIYDKVITSQTCIRLGGKHNDFDSIGESKHHNTSFEMLGNFSFKNTSEVDTIKLCWKFLTEILSLDINKLYVTVHENDSKLKSIWIDIIGLPSSKVLSGTDDSNFWSMDEVGPCGYCTEIFYNVNSDSSNLDLLEIWNIVFIEFNRKDGKLFKLSDIYVDTGMGLERITSVIQGHYDNFKLDMYRSLLDITSFGKINFLDSDSIRRYNIIVDHLKTSILLLNEGLIPSNDGRGYVLKKLIRKSILNRMELGIKDYLYTFVDKYISVIDNRKKYMESDIKIIKDILKNEEVKFIKTINNGVIFLKNLISSKKKISGKDLFYLYDTYGMPLDYTTKVLLDFNISIDLDEFNVEMKKQILNSKKKTTSDILFLDLDKTIFNGYSNFFIEGHIVKIMKNNIYSDFLYEGDEGILILDNTTFYSEKGGQVGDIGVIENAFGSFSVLDTKEINGIYFHYGRMISGFLKLSDKVLSKVDVDNRTGCSNNHSSTHLLHHALKKILGNHIRQAGSYICSKYFRFDFTHFEALSSQDISNIEFYINSLILSNLQVKTFIDIDKISGKSIRTVVIGDDVSVELCAGTHVNTTGNIGLFKILKEIGIGNNLRRIEAISGIEIIRNFNLNENYLNFLTDKLKSTRENLSLSVDKIIEKNKILEKKMYSFYLNDLLRDFENSENFFYLDKIKIFDLFKDKEYLNCLKNSFFLLENSILLFYYKDNDKLYLNIYISNDLSFINIFDFASFLKKNSNFIGGGKGKFLSGIVLSREESSKYIYYYLKSKIKSEENNVNFN